MTCLASPLSSRLYLPPHLHSLAPHRDNSVPCGYACAPQAMGLGMVAGGVIVSLYRLVHVNAVEDWRSPTIAVGVGLATALFAALGLHSANGFNLQSVRC